ncbi:MAG: CDP-diacylglycerol--serine O-phosphatidyltransferase [Candidatus Dactylopiibacterium sp.]|nr:CDP-diacylglycerol--serine O-phosphatidyltransferase [Candidatus Dactylopiibacterium sp.]
MNDQILETEDQDARQRSRAIYILPNLFTSAALFCGFYAIVQAMNTHFDLACIAIFIAMVLDGLDGRVARLTNTQSQFGAEYDSLSDMVAFGAAPALVIYEWALKDLGKLGWIAAFIYCVSAALRLARFNTNISVVDKRYFQGLPSPAAAALVTGFIWIMNDNGVSGTAHLIGGIQMEWIAFIVALFAGVSMVTNVLFWSGKSINLRRAVPFSFALAFIAVLLAVHYDPPAVLFGLFVCYGLSGYVLSAWRYLRRNRSASAPK